VSNYVGMNRFRFLNNSYSLFFLPLFLLLIGTYIFPIRILGLDFSMIPGDMGDARFNNFILEHGYQYLIGKVEHYWDASFMYPTKNVIAFSDNLLGTMPIYAIFRLLDVDRETSFQLWFLTICVLNYVFCFFALKKWSNSIILSSVGAYIFAFGLFNIGQIYHVQVFPRFLIPFLFYWCWKYLKDKEIKYLTFLLFGIVYQFYCGIYLGFFVIYSLLFILISYVIVYKDLTLIKQFGEIKKIILTLGLIIFSGLILLPLILPYIEVSQSLGMREFDEVIYSIPRPSSYFFSTPASTLWGKLFYTHSAYGFEEWWLHFIFPGILPWLAIFFLPVVLMMRNIDLKKRRTLIFISTAFLLSIVFCLNIGGVTLYKIIFEIPGFSSMRALNRIINTQIIFFILILVFVFVTLQEKYKWAKVLVYILPILVIVDNVFDLNWEVRRFSKDEAITNVTIVKETILKEHDKKFDVIAYSLSEEDKKSHTKVIETHISVMLACQELGLTCVNGILGSYPDNYMSFFDHTDENSLKKWCLESKININSIQLIQLESSN